MRISELINQSKSIPRLYHISFQNKKDGMWYPMNPAVSDFTEKTDISEPDLPRISFAPSIKQCFWAIYPNVSKYFEVENYPYMDFFVYQPMLTGKERVLTPDELTKLRYVHDAYMTQEYVVLDTVYVKNIGKVRIFNSNESDSVNYRPFDDSDKEEKFLAPKNISIKSLKD